MNDLLIHLRLKRAWPLLILVLVLTACSGRASMQASSWPGVALTDQTLYIAYNQFVRAIDLETERELWRFPTEPDRTVTFYAPPAVAEDGTIILGGYDKKVYAISADNGQPVVKWTFEESADRIIGGPAISGDIVLVPSADYHLYALDVSTGRSVWSQPFQSDHALWSAPLIDGDMVYLASLDHSVYALDLESGDLLWENDLGSAISDTPSLSNGLLLCGTFEGVLFALDKETGREAWRFEAGAAIWGNPIVSDEVVYVADVDGDAFALDLDRGAELWRQKLASSASTSPITDDSKVFFVSEEGSIEAFAKDSGDPSWPASATVLGRLLADPILIEDELFVPVMDNEECVIFGVNVDTGSTRCAVQQPQN